MWHAGWLGLVLQPLSLSEFQPTGQSFRIPTAAPVSMRTIWPLALPPPSAWKWHPHKVYIHDQGQAGGHPVESGCFLPRLCFHTCDHRERLGYTGMRSTKLRAFLSSGAARPSTGQGTAKVSADPVGYPG